MTFEGKLYMVNNTNDWRFNHYNTNAGMIVGAQKKGWTNSTKLIKDDSGKRYHEVLEKICLGKCSDTHQYKCDMFDTKQTGKFVCPKFGVEYK